MATEPRNRAQVTRVQLQRVLAIVVPPLAALSFFLVLMPNQWLRLDDFSMVETIASTPVAELVLEIVTTRTTPHVRFAFLHHLVLLPFFRWGFDVQWAIDLLYFATCVIIVSGYAAVTRLTKGSLTLVGLGLLGLGVFTSIPVWATLEFKTAGYLLFAFGAACWLAVGAEHISLEGAPPSTHAWWIAWAIVCLHLAEAAFGVGLLLATRLVVERRLRLRAAGLLLAWPAVFWTINRFGFPRPTNLLGHTLSGGASAAVRVAAAAAWANWRAELVLAVIIWVIVAGALQRSGRPSRAVLASLVSLAAFPGAGLGVLLLAALSYQWVGERHIAFAGLCLIAASAAGVAKLEPLAPRLALGVGLAAGAIGLVRIGSAAQTLSYARGRGHELHQLRSLRETVQERARQTTSDEIVVFLPLWTVASPDGHWLEPSAFGADWSRLSFEKKFSCPGDRPRCPRVTYLRNFDAYRTRMTRAERSALCSRLATADVLISEHETRPPDGEACDRWLLDQRLVDAAD